MANEQTSVADVFRRAQVLMRENPEMSLKGLKARLLNEYKGAPMPPLRTVTIPEQDALAPEEDWTAGLAVVRRGIQNEDWGEIVSGVLLSLEQTVRYERERGPVGTDDDWHDRSVGIRGQLEKGLGKWMPDELVKLAERAAKK